MRNLTSKPPAIQKIRAEIEGVPEERIFEALDLVAAAHRSDQGAPDPFKNFVWNLKKLNRIPRNPTTQQDEIDRSQQASVGETDS